MGYPEWSELKQNAANEKKEEHKKNRNIENILILKIPIDENKCVEWTKLLNILVEEGCTPR